MIASPSGFAHDAHPICRSFRTLAPASISAHRISISVQTATVSAPNIASQETQTDRNITTPPAICSVHQESTACGDRLSRNPLCVLTREPRHNSSNVVRSTHPVLNGSHLELPLHHFLGHTIEHLRLGRSRRHGVYSVPCASEFLGQAARNTFDCCLGAGI